MSLKASPNFHRRFITSSLYSAIKIRVNISRRKFLSVGCLGSGALLVDARYEPHSLECTEKPVRLSKPLARPVRILHISDFHWSHSVKLSFIEHAIDLGLAMNPDVICFTGDFVTDRRMNIAEYVPVLRKLSGSRPTYSVLGNHDGGAWAAKAEGYKTTEPMLGVLADAGVVALQNQSQVLNVQGQELLMIGVGDLWAGEVKPQAAFASVTATDPRAKVLLSHNPDSKEMLATYPWDLMLCGHTHGGQLIVPVLGITPFAPVRDQRFVHGLNTWDAHQIHTTRGVGSLHGLRINCRPEVSLLVLQ